MFGLTPWREKERTEYSLANLRNEFKALYDRFLHGWPVPFEAFMERERFWGMDLEETEKEFVMRAEVPGFELEDLEVSLRGNELLLRAEKKAKENEKRPTPERPVYERFVKLSAEIDPEKIEARYHNGVLEVRLPKAATARVKHVPIKDT